MSHLGPDGEPEPYGTEAQREVGREIAAKMFQKASAPTPAELPPTVFAEENDTPDLELTLYEEEKKDE